MSLPTWGPIRDDGLPETVTFRGEEFETPELEDIRYMVYDSVVDALDECQVEPDGTCPHGYPSWLIALGLC